MNFARKNIVLILAGFVIFFVVISYTYLQFFSNKKGQTPQVPIFISPSVSPIVSVTPQNSPSTTYNGIKQQITEEDKIKETQQITVTKFAFKLPITDKNFIISYDIDINTFYVQITSNLKSANQELDALLIQNGIMDRSWITHLIIK